MHAKIDFGRGYDPIPPLNHVCATARIPRGVGEGETREKRHEGKKQFVSVEIDGGRWAFCTAATVISSYNTGLSSVSSARHSLQVTCSRACFRWPYSTDLRVTHSCGYNFCITFSHGVFDFIIVIITVMTKQIRFFFWTMIFSLCFGRENAKIWILQTPVARLDIAVLYSNIMILGYSLRL